MVRHGRFGSAVVIAFVCATCPAAFSQSTPQPQPRETPFGTSALTRQWKGHPVVELPFGYVLFTSIWPKAKVPIRVCWENPDDADGHLRDSVRDAVASTWERESKVTFAGWGPCGAKSPGIRILVNDDGPHVKALGYYLDGRPNGMVLNFKFKTWSTSCQKQVNSCVWALAVHEFGHALGFAHEQNRDDAPEKCRAERQGRDGDYKVTAYDPDSVMNYCNKNWNNNGHLSARDIDAVRAIYGAP